MTTLITSDNTGVCSTLAGGILIGMVYCLVTMESLVTLLQSPVACMITLMRWALHTNLLCHHVISSMIKGSQICPTVQVWAWASCSASDNTITCIYIT